MRFAFSFQVVPLLLLTIYTAVYGYVQPYQSKLTNLIEAAVNINFLVLLILNATAFFRDDYLTFPNLSHSANDTCSDSVHGIATVSWILMPFYYLPLGALCVILLAALLAYIRYEKCSWPGVFSTDMYIIGNRKKIRSSDTDTVLGEETILSRESDVNHKVDYTRWSIDLNADGFLHLVTEPDDNIPLVDQN